MPDSPFEAALDLRVAELLERCTSCGACVEVCPMPEAAGIDASDPQAIAGGVLDILRGSAQPEASARWASVCSGSGHCIPACQYGVNPRTMLAMARLAMQKRKDMGSRRKDAFAKFGGMTKGVRVLSRMQLPPELLSRFRADDAEDDTPPDIVFYTGCNLIKTPHIALLCFDIMEALGVHYRVMGGPSTCCGILQFRAGDVATSGRIAFRTIERLAGAVDGRAVTWCPTCQIQLSEVVVPSSPTQLDLQPFVLFLGSRLEALRPLLVNRVEKRVGLHEHPGLAGVCESARAILEAIPGLEFVDLAQPRIGYTCNALNPLPGVKQEEHRSQLQLAADAGVTTLAGIYHNCHRELCSHERDWPFEVVNFLELVGESMGLTRPDLFKRLKLMQDVDAVLADRAALLAENGIDLEEAREVVLADMLGEQALPLRGA